MAEGKTEIRTDLYDLDSLLIHYVPFTGSGSAQEAPEKQRRTLALPQRVRCSLSEPNVYLLDKAQFRLDNGPWQEVQELLRADNVLREYLGWPSRQASVAQPWTIQEERAEHTVQLRFTVECAAPVADTWLALEDAQAAAITCNGVLVTAKPEGWYVDKSIGKVFLGDLKEGTNIIEVTLPFGLRTNVEWCYLLGDFGVEVAGQYRWLVPARKLLGWDDVTKQGLAHYGGNITYHIPFTTSGGNVRLTVPHYAGAAVRAELDGRKEIIAYPPYMVELGQLPAGEHELKLTLLGNRRNSFGAVHLADSKHSWHGPDAWRTEGSRWTESYRLVPLGILSAPVMEEEV